MQRHVSAVLCVLLAAGVALPPTVRAAAAQEKSTIIQRIIVKVNGEIFTQSELEREQIAALRQRNRVVKSPQDLTSDESLRKILGEITPDILIEAIDEMLLVQRGREIGDKFSEETFKRAIEDIKKRNNLDDAGLAAAMKQEGITREDLRQQVERQYYVAQVQSKEIPVTLTEEEIRQYYKAHPQEFMKPATVTLRELRVSTASGGDEAAALAKIKLATDRAAKGEDFAKIVGELSDSGTKSSGGLIENVSLDVISADFRAAIEKAKVGDITAPVKTEDGFVVFKIEARTPPLPIPIEEVQDQIAQKLFDERMGVETRRHIEKLRAQALIEWKDDGYKKLYEQRVAERKTAKGSPV